MERKWRNEPPPPKPDEVKALIDTLRAFYKTGLDQITEQQVAAMISALSWVHDGHMRPVMGAMVEIAKAKMVTPDTSCRGGCC